MTPDDVDVRRFRTIAGRFGTGVGVATTCVDGVPVGMTVNSFTTVSLEPRLVLVCLAEGSRLLRAVRRSGYFAVTVLADDQRALAVRFAARERPSGCEAFRGVDSVTEPITGCPVLSGGVAFFACAVHRLWPAGDHSVLVGEVTSAGELLAAAPLLFVDGHYRVLADPDGGAE
ncbi:flavin reductase family protein [Cellulomonas wangsupingiae]|uniref:Flavin reductase family protein n=1 Tax=Cellulomonas wangsupingiae TaxID=2968085 RepID=A0ABY5K8H9_9CELL|nr:flavin reductase family protein [Cellulomonas wangsupingiae]MCC2333051.1 flavin reductase family protein [Cellulomonas wangsupingiae]MCM0640409.1 flavin reductase family protein [Cellulomonas wangsupingiae]UUI66767.1 flavin reductase family protein [Cellulomonas wangsupingiae]